MFLLAGMPAHAGKIGHIAFYIDTNDAQFSKKSEIYYDFIYTYENTNSWIRDHNLASSFHESFNFKIKIDNNNEIEFTTNNLNSSVGIILIKENGIYKEIPPATDIDLINEFKEFYGIKR